ncbi:hypothetical protein AAFF_G00060270 [Aldrovandia affinis]|uniref:Uncharacterized protein n=1 Tax=Aldrovandia affinis TaxID=143900 RepID=A0AAD7WF16_9TELE|nr:hypothetical protein AAFF_G00060270 [Aldrovandia affinis]
MEHKKMTEYLPFMRNGLPSPTTMRRGCEMRSQTLREEEEEEEVEREVPAAAPEEGSEILADRFQAQDHLAWSLSSLEHALYLSLPAWVRAALLCNLMPQIGLTGFPNTLPARVMSYLLLPYTLTVSIFFTFTYRLVLRLKHIANDAYWLWQDMKQVVRFFFNVAVSSLKKNVVDRFLPSSYLRPTLEYLSECEGPTGTSHLRRRSTLRLQLSTAGSAPDDSTGSKPRAFAFLLDLALEVDSQPDAPGPTPGLCQQPLPLEHHPDSEGELEASATPYISFPLDEEEEEEEEDGSRDGMD